MYFQFNKNDTSKNIFRCCYNERYLFPQTHTTNTRAIFQYNIRHEFGGYDHDMHTSRACTQNSNNILGVKIETNIWWEARESEGFE